MLFIDTVYLFAHLKHFSLDFEPEVGAFFNFVLCFFFLRPRPRLPEILESSLLYFKPLNHMMNIFNSARCS